MVEIVDNKWRAFLKLSSVEIAWKDEKRGLTDIGPVYFDVNSHPIMTWVEKDKYTVIELPSREDIFVRETPEEIIKAADEMISVEQDKKAKQAEEYYAEMMKAKKAGDK